MSRPRRLRDQYINGLEALGYGVDPKRRSTIYRIYKKPGSEFRFLVGEAGALRITSTTIERSRTAGTATKNHVITAPERRPLVYLACNSLGAFEDTPEDPETLAMELKERDMGMAVIPLKSLILHVKAWQHYEKARRSYGADIPSDSGGAASQLPEGPSGSAAGGDVV